MIISGFALTDKGIVKKVNQDSVLLKIVSTSSNEDVCIALVCDGMGGHQCGELASATVVNSFLTWFNEATKNNIVDKKIKDIRDEWMLLIGDTNNHIAEFGRNQNIILGTTLSAIFIKKNEYIIANIGDSRVYLINKSIKQLTEDQSFVARELKRGTITEEEAKVHPKRNVLLQCIGASNNISPDFISGEIKANDKFLICSDGFRHVISTDEILSAAEAGNDIEICPIKNAFENLFELIKHRGERDNISAVLIEIANSKEIISSSEEITLNLEDITIRLGCEQNIDIKCEQVLKDTTDII